MLLIIIDSIYFNDLNVVNPSSETPVLFKSDGKIVTELCLYNNRSIAGRFLEVGRCPILNNSAGLASIINILSSGIKILLRFKILSTLFVDETKFKSIL